MTDITKVVFPTELFSEDPLEIFADPEKRRQMIEYLRATRAKFLESEAAGTRKRKKDPEPERKTIDDILNSK